MEAPGLDHRPRQVSNPLSVRQWSVDEWLNCESQWTDLLTRSEADPLFLSWEWLTSWWKSFGADLAADPCILAFYRGDRLVGAAPLYRKREFRRRVIPVNSVQLVGLSWRDSERIVSEYMDVVAEPDHVESVRSACIGQLIRDGGWSEFSIGFTAASSEWADAFSDVARSCGCYVRELDSSISHQASLGEGFPKYLEGLGQSTRRSLWHLRKRLNSHGKVTLERVPDDEISSALNDLNRLHLMRWQRTAFTGQRLAFHENLATRMAARRQLIMTRLRVGERVVSVAYDIRAGDRQYNIKLGFDPTLSSQVSIGLIHLGYLLEEAAGAGVVIYDFLAGRGRSSDYKTHLSQIRIELRSIQMLKGHLLPRLYKWHDQLTHGLRHAP